MTKKDFYYPRVPKDFLDATRGWGWRLTSFYSVLLDVIYHHGGEVEDDLEEMRTWIGKDLKPNQWRALRGALIAEGKLYISETGTLRNPVADKWIAERSSEQKRKQGAKRSTKRSESDLNTSANIDRFDGKKGNKNNKTTPELPLEIPQKFQRESESELESEKKKEVVSLGQAMIEVGNIAAALSQKSGKYWEPDYRAMRKRGLAYEDILAAARKHRGDPINSITRLEGLAKKICEDRLARGGVYEPSPLPTQPATDAEYAKALPRLLSHGLWNDLKLGPAPMHRGTMVPERLREEFFRRWIAQGAHPLNELSSQLHFVPYPAKHVSPEHRAVWEPQP